MGPDTTSSQAPTGGTAATGTSQGAPVLDRVRGIVVVLGPSIVLLLGIATATVVAISGWTSCRPRSRVDRLVRMATTCVALAPIPYLLVMRPWMRRWGTIRAERTAPLPGDEFLPAHGPRITRAITIDAPTSSVWPWLAQIGRDRGGFYSYEWLENLAACRIRNADRIHPEWQHVEAGGRVWLHPAIGLPVAGVEPGRFLALEGWATLSLVPGEDEQTRLYVRAGLPTGIAGAFYALLIEIPHFIMERKMLLGIRDRAEREARPL